MEIYNCVMVAEDSDMIAVLKGYADNLPYLEIVGIVSNTDEASDLVEVKKPDILFIDITIPGVEGPEFAFLLDHQPEMIIMGEKEKDSSENYFVEIGEYMQKPGTPDEFKAAIDACIANLEMYRV